MYGVFKVKKALFPRDKNWGKIKKINKAREARNERDAKQLGLTKEGLKQLLQPIDKAFPDLRMSRRRPAPMEEGDVAANGEDGADDVPALNPKRNRRAARAGGDAANPANNGNGGGETIVEIIEHPIKTMSKVHCRRKGILWFHRKGVGDAKGTFQGWADWMSAYRDENNTQLPKQGFQGLVHSSMIIRQMALGEKIDTGSAADSGNAWTFYSDCGQMPGVQRLHGPDSTSDPTTTRVSHFFTAYDMFKATNWKCELWPALAMNRQENTGRTQPIMFLDVAWDRDSIAKNNDFDYRFQETATPSEQLLENFPVLNNQSCERYQLGATKTVIPMKLMKREDHITGTTGSANRTNTTAEADKETLWYDLNHITNPTCKQMVTQMHVYEESVKKKPKRNRLHNVSNRLQRQDRQFHMHPVCDFSRRNIRILSLIMIPYACAVVCTILMCIFVPCLT